MSTTTLTDEELAVYEAFSGVENAYDLGLENAFYLEDGEIHQHGIQLTSWTRYGCFVQFDFNAKATARDVQVLLATWTATFSMLQANEDLGDIRPDKGSAVPGDTADAHGLPCANMSIVLGFGPKLFAEDRFGLEAFRPEGFEELPRITNDHFVASEQGSDFGMWIKADDWGILFHAVRALARIGRKHHCDLVHTHNGFLSARQHGPSGTSRAIHGFVVGLTGCYGDEEFDKYVWVNDCDQEWMVGGTYMVYRDTQFQIETWDQDRISDQEQCLGRRKDNGAPLTSGPDGSPFDEFDWDATDENGELIIPGNCHCRLVSEHHQGFKTYDDGMRSWRGLLDNGTQDTGFVNIFYANDLQHFIKLRDDMGKYDLAKEYYWDNKSATYAIPHGVQKGHYFGEEFFA